MCDEKQWQCEFESTNGKIYGIVGPSAVPGVPGTFDRREVRGLLGFGLLWNRVGDSRSALLRLERGGGKLRRAIAAPQEAYKSYHRLGGN